MPHKEKQDWKEEFEKKHYGAMFECGDYDKLIEDIESTHTTLLQSVVKDLLDKITIPINPSNEDQRDWYRGLGKEEQARKIREDIISYFKNKHRLDI